MGFFSRLMLERRELCRRKRKVVGEKETCLEFFAKGLSCSVFKVKTGLEGLRRSPRLAEKEERYVVRTPHKGFDSWFRGLKKVLVEAALSAEINRLLKAPIAPRTYGFLISTQRLNDQSTSPSPPSAATSKSQTTPSERTTSKTRTGSSSPEYFVGALMQDTIPSHAGTWSVEFKPKVGLPYKPGGYKSRPTILHEGVDYRLFFQALSDYDRQTEAITRGDIKSTLGDMRSTRGDMKSTLGDKKSTLGDMKSTLGDIKSTVEGREMSMLRSFLRQLETGGRLSMIESGVLGSTLSDPRLDAVALGLLQPASIRLARFLCVFHAFGEGVQDLMVHIGATVTDDIDISITHALSSLPPVSSAVPSLPVSFAVSPETKPLGTSLETRSLEAEERELMAEALKILSLDTDSKTGQTAKLRKRRKTKRELKDTPTAHMETADQVTEVADQVTETRHQIMETAISPGFFESCVRLQKQNALYVARLSASLSGESSVAVDSNGLLGLGRKALERYLLTRMFADIGLVLKSQLHGREKPLQLSIVDIEAKQPRNLLK